RHPDRDGVRGQRGPAPLPGRAPADDRRCPRHGDVRLSPDGQAVVPVGDPLGRSPRVADAPGRRAPPRRCAAAPHSWSGPGGSGAERAWPANHRLPCSLRGAPSPRARNEVDNVPVEPVQTLILLAVVANLAVMASVVLPPLLGRRGSASGSGSSVDAGDRHSLELAALVGDTDVDLGDQGSVPPGAYDRVVRIVSWVFILATTTIVAVTGLWSEAHAAIFALLAAAGLFVLVVHDLLPAGALGTAKFVLEGSVAITFATLLVVLTGRDQSPFFFTFPLIVGGAALVVSPRVTLALASAACLAYLLAIAPPGSGGLHPQTIAIVGINITALVLLAYVAMVIAREQRRARDAAIRLSTIDPLTGLFNRTFFFAAVEREIARSARSGRGFCLLMMDLDELKQINDRHGHFFGDRVIRGVGEVIRSAGRRIDTAARYGG